jgi:hypothetical protein
MHFFQKFKSRKKDAIYPQNKLMPADPYTKARHHMLVENFQRVAALLYKGMKFKDPEAYNEINKILDNYEKALEGDYFGGGAKFLLKCDQALYILISSKFKENKLALLTS